MTKLEKKLIELGYDNKLGYYDKDFGCIEIRIYVNPNYIQPTQQAFNQLQNDLEVLKEYETNTHYPLASFRDTKSVDEFQSLLGEHLYEIFKEQIERNEKKFRSVK